MAAKARLTYFQGRGKGELIRLTLASAGIEFEDNFLLEPEQFQKLKDDGVLPFLQVPLLEIDGMNVVQTHAIARYIAHKHGLMGTTPEERLMIDMMFEGSRDLLNLDFMLVAFLETDEQKYLSTQTIKKNAKEKFLPCFEKVYKKSTSGFLVGDSLSLADIAWLEALLWLHEVEPQFAVTFPSVAAFTSKMSALPRISEFLKGPQRQPPPDEVYVATVKKVLGW